MRYMDEPCQELCETDLSSRRRRQSAPQAYEARLQTHVCICIYIYIYIHIYI